MIRALTAWITLTLLALCLGGCTAPTEAMASPTALDPLAQAAREATAIVQQAQATALVLRAQAQATRLISQAGEGPSIQESLPEETVSSIIQITPEPSMPLDTPVLLDTPAGGTGPETVELLGIGFAAEGGFIIINFKAPPSITQTWWQGSVEVIDEASKTVYNEIPVLPVIGPLIGRPVEAGQNGYVMLTHNPPTLRPGSLVTVTLGDYKFEHVKVE